MRPNFRTTSLVAFTVLSLALDARAATEKVAFSGFSSSESFTQAQVDALEDLVTTELTKRSQRPVIGRGDVVAMIGFEQQRLLLGCEESSCMAEIGGALGVRWLVSGTLARLGRETVLSLKLIDLTSAAVVARTTRRAPGEDRLADQSEGAVAELVAVSPLAPKAEGKPATIVVSGLAAVAIGAAVVFGMQAIQAADRWRAATDDTAWTTAKREAEGFGSASTAAWIVAGAAGAGALGLGVFTTF